MATTPPALEPFNTSKDDWNAWSRRFEQWLSLSSYSTGENADAKKRAAFCTYIDSATFKLLCSFCAPKKPEELTFEALKAKLDSQNGTKKIVLAERYRFYNYKQRDGQSLPDYIAELRRLAVTCEWSEQHLEDNLQDKFIMGLRNECLLQQLLTQDHMKPLAELMELAHIFEAAENKTLNVWTPAIARMLSLQAGLRPLEVKPTTPRRKSATSTRPQWKFSVTTVCKLWR